MALHGVVLLPFLGDILIRYKQTVIGVFYPILVGSMSMLLWQYVASAFAEAGNSLVGRANLLSKAYFPRVLIPASNSTRNANG